MAVTNRDFINVANEILQNASGEIDYRNAISRAYYAGYHVGKNLDKKPLVPNQFSHKSGSHQNLIDSLKKNTNASIRKIGFILQACKIERTLADYQLSAHIDKPRAQNVIALINEIFQIARKIDPK